ncbi:MAG: 2-dehydropantoate 2-reductase [Verrucomicrobiota bacterium]|nr:2-dehydropantoate 2-reductase [Verrucomicrobiota bacterium]
MRIAVVGAGAIGSYYGAKLARTECDVNFLMRSQLEDVRRAGIHVREKEGGFRVTNLKCYGTTPEIGPCDLVLVALKTTANGALLELIPPLLHAGTMLVTLQNGLGNEEFLAEHFGADRVLGGLCFVCLNRIAPGVIDHHDVGRLAVGEYKGEPRQRTFAVVELFARAGVNCSVADDLRVERWRKLVWNIPFNGLAVAAGGVTTDVILRDHDLHRATQALMAEIINAANACGVPVSQNEAELQLQRTASLGAYKPSTLIDFEAGRPLEIDAIWGEPLRRARAAGASTPRLEMLCALLTSLDRQCQLS